MIVGDGRRPRESTSFSGRINICLSPASLTFPAELTGATSPPQTVTVSDTGNASLFINGLSVRGIATLDYTITDDECSGVTVPAGGPTPLAIATPGMPCSAGACDPTGGSPQITGNFWAAAFSATGGTAPYTWSAVGPLPSGLTLTVREALSGGAIAGKTPSGQAQEDESHLTACGGFGILTVSVSNVNMANGTVLWVSLDTKTVGTITLNGGQGAMRAYNLGDFAVSFDQVTIVSTPPPAVNGQTSVLSGGSFS